MLSYPDGSTTTIQYLAQSDPKLPKERFEVSAGGNTAICSNFRTTQFSGRSNVQGLSQNKGQATAIQEVVRAVINGDPSPIRLEEIVNVSRVTFGMLESAGSGLPVALDR